MQLSGACPGEPTVTAKALKWGAYLGELRTAEAITAGTERRRAK